MSDQKLCDFCEEIVTNKIYLISVTEAELPKDTNKLVEFVTLEKAINLLEEKQNTYMKNTTHYEICEECKKVFDYLLMMRVNNLKQLKREINGLLKLPYDKKENKND